VVDPPVVLGRRRGGKNVSSGTVYWAHIGGFVFGIVVAWLFYRDRRPSRLAETGDGFPY
jgi:membrane associated rhomboid family serine protease